MWTYIYFVRDRYGSMFTRIEYGTASTRPIERAGCAILNSSRLNFVHDFKLSQKFIEYNDLLFGAVNELILITPLEALLNASIFPKSFDDFVEFLKSEQYH